VNFCIQCGAKLEIEHKFCVACGQPKVSQAPLSDSSVPLSSSINLGKNPQPEGNPQGPKGQDARGMRNFNSLSLDQVKKWRASGLDLRTWDGEYDFDHWLRQNRTKKLGRIFSYVSVLVLVVLILALAGGAGV
jgi:hypothetical protein